MCSVADRFLVVTGSRIEHDNAHTSVEFYNIEMDIWFDQPKLNHGRYYHASCAFNDRWIYVFAGIDCTTKRYFSSIERFDANATSDDKKEWEVIQNVAPSFTMRQGSGCAQISSDEILVFGGFGGEFQDDVFTFKHTSGQMERHERDAPQRLFSYQMPTIVDHQMKHVLTVDWKTKKALVFQNDRTWQLLKELV